MTVLVSFFQLCANIAGNQGTTMNRTNGEADDADTEHEPGSMDVYYIVADKCTECKGFHEEPQCAAVCPVDCCVDDPDVRETDEALLAKKDFLHL